LKEEIKDNIELRKEANPKLSKKLLEKIEV